jgi:hypothetical protein
MNTFIRTQHCFASHAIHYALNALSRQTLHAQNVKTRLEYHLLETHATAKKAISIKTRLYSANHATLYA